MTSPLAELLHEDRRLVILRALSEVDDKSLNESLIEKVLRRVRLGIVSRAMVRGYLTWLEQNDLVTIDKLQGGAVPGELWTATATHQGQAVARGLSFPGVAQPSS
ncbi:VpaChn25_0724 family phage protein [Plastoroseomonas hellenica]|uniref:VpaChn25_0724 family phage protein n=1 Tax=Plastoroseomonas hellenica TaxID=2687306 RepID=UPI001BAA3939|nr:hypothetical protein [Plastoroseomonas hellenica]MBR0644002.1 ArsR family transcriptional regulator [Plastoroseomonas hellenica]